MLKKIRKNSKIIFLILSVIFSIPAVIGLLHQGFPLTDDGNWMVIRFSAFYEVLKSGEFPVRFLTRLNNGYGYPVADFLYPLFMYIGVPVHILGFNFTNTIKLILGLSLISSSLFAYLWLRRIFDNLASLMGSIFYTFFPYHLFDVYKRGSVGEVLSLSILPFILWQVERKSLILTSLGIALLILAHNTLALFFVPLVFLYTTLRQKKSLKFNILSLILGFGMSSFFLIPALYDTRYTVFGSTKVSDFYDFFISFENIGILGPVFFVILISSLFLLFANKDKLFKYSFIASMIISFFLFPFSEIFWRVLPFINLIQFPFRLISLIIVLLAFQAAFLISVLKGNKKILISLVLLVLIFLSAKPYLLPKDYQYFPDTFYSTNQDSTTVRNEYMPKWVNNIPTSMYSSKVEVINGSEKINTLKVTPNKTVFEVYLPSERLVQVNMVYFPGWEALVNGQKANISYDNPSGLIRLNLNKGTNNVSVMFGETPVRILGDLISIISLFLVFAVYLLEKQKKIKI